MAPLAEIDISENKLRQKGDILDILLLDRTTKRNIIWATDSYIRKGREFTPNKQVKPELVTGIYRKLIQPRAAKSIEEQRYRTKEMAEVFTPISIIDRMNKEIDRVQELNRTGLQPWQDYVKELRLEITCGEAPFIVSRYNPTVHNAQIKNVKYRVGFLDRKLHVVSNHCHRPKEWLKWAKEAYKASYGYEWQGDNILIARENLLYTLLDHYEAKFGRNPSLAVQKEFAEIISWNIFQMDGIKYVKPMSCKHQERIVKEGLPLFNEPDVVEKDECEGCKFNRPLRHNGRYVYIMDWSIMKPIKFVELLREA